MGGFDATIPFYGEDTDIARRLSAIGQVIFRMNFTNWTSMRRFRAEGIIMTSARYAVNFLWPVVFHRPFSRTHRIVR